MCTVQPRYLHYIKLMPCHYCYVVFDLAFAFVLVLTFEHLSLGLGLGLVCQGHGLSLGLEILINTDWCIVTHSCAMV